MPASAQCAQQLLPAIDDLQQQEIRTSATPRAPGAVSRAGQRLAALVQHAGDFREQAGKRRRSRADQRGRDPAVVERDPPIRRDLGDAGKADAEIAGAVLGLQHVAQPQPADLQLRRLRGGGMRIVRLETR